MSVFSIVSIIPWMHWANLIPPPNKEESPKVKMARTILNPAATHFERVPESALDVTLIESDKPFARFIRFVIAETLSVGDECSIRSAAESAASQARLLHGATPAPALLHVSEPCAGVNVHLAGH